MTPKKIVFLFFAIMVVLPAVVRADVRPIHVEWSYSGSAASYNLYKDGALVCVSNTPAVLWMDCNVFIETVPMAFVLAAVDAAGVESPQSAPYTLVPPPQDATGNYIPQGDIVADVTTGDVPLLVNFDASASSDLDGTIAATDYYWDYGDGSVDSGVAVSHTFVTVGIYTVTLTVTDDLGASSDTTVTITVTDPAQINPPVNVPPTAVITAAPLQISASIIAFDAYGSNDPDGIITTYSWNFGDGDVASGDYVEHEFLAAGDYTVVLTVIDDGGASAQDQMLVTVVDPPATNIAPVASISASATEQLAHFSWDHPVDATIGGFRFYQNDELVCDIADPVARTADCPIYVANGLVQIWMTSYDTNGLESATVSQMFTFDSTGITADLVSGDAPLSVHFNAGNSYDDDGSIVAYDWNYGDGSVGSGLSADHIYTVPGVYTVTLTVKDDAGDTAQISTDVTITGNQPPSALNSSLVTDQNASISGILSASDPEGDALTFMVTTNGSKGTATITNSTTGVFTYVPNTDAVGPDSFSFKVNDGVLDSNLATVIIDIQQLNRAPAAQNQNITVAEDSLVIGTLTATDADGDALTYSIVSNSVNGNTQITDAVGGTFTYTPNANFYGSDSLTFAASDGVLDSIGTVSITVTAVNDQPVAGNTAITVAEDTVVTGSITASDADGDKLVYTVAVGGTIGRAVVDAATGDYQYTPDLNVVGGDRFAVMVDDGQGGTVLAEVSATITAVNDPPVAGDDTAVTEVDRAVSIDVLVNDSDVDGDLLTVTLNSQPANGSASMKGNAIIYTPAPGFIGADSLTYSVTDGTVFSSAQVNITVTPPQVLVVVNWDYDANAVVSGFKLYYNGAYVCETSDPLARQLSCNIPKENAAKIFTLTAVDQAGVESTVSNALTYDPAIFNNNPVAVDDVVVTDEDTPVIVNLLSNDSDADGDALALASAEVAAFGTVVISGNSVTYTPNADAHGTDSFTYSITDGQGGSAVATVKVTVNSVNDIPLVLDASLTAVEDSVLNSSLSGTDVDGDALTYSVVSNGTLGSAVITDAASGAFTYTPNADAFGRDQFTFTASDGVAVSQIGTVVIDITPLNDVPVATDDNAVLNEDSNITIDVLANDSDADGDLLTIESVLQPANGTAVAAVGGIIYTPNPDFNGSDVFTYTVNDANGGVASATVNITISSVNDAPVALDDSSVLDEDGNVTINVLTNDSDADGDVLSLGSVTAATNGAVVVSGSSLLYTPNTNYNGSDSFSYTINDANGATASALVTVTVNSVNDSPEAVDDAAQVESGASVTINLLANDSDVDGDVLSISSIAQPTNGQIVLSGGDVVYTANAGFVGNDSFMYTISDSQRGSATGSVNITVTQPMQQITMSWDYSGDVSLINGFRLYANASLVCETADAAARQLTCKIPLSGAVKTFTVTAIEAAGESTMSNAIVYDPNPAPVNTPPVAVDNNATTEGTAPVTVDLLANDSDADGDVLTVAAVSQPLNGNVSLQGNNVVYTANSGFVGTDSFTYDVTDGIDTTTAAVNITVQQPMQQVSFNWDFDPTVTANSFRLYVNGSQMCEVFDSSARQATCLVPQIIGTQSFAITYVDATGLESAVSNTLSY